MLMLQYFDITFFKYHFLYGLFLTLNQSFFFLHICTGIEKAKNINSQILFNYKKQILGIFFCHLDCMFSLKKRAIIFATDNSCQLQMILITCIKQIIALNKEILCSHNSRRLLMNFNAYLTFTLHVINIMICLCVILSYICPCAMYFKSCLIDHFA